MNEEPQVPFLVAQAQPPIEDEIATNAEDAPENHPEWFHTRCGHPRHRDD